MVYSVTTQPTRVMGKLSGNSNVRLAQVLARAWHPKSYAHSELIKRNFGLSFGAFVRILRECCWLGSGATTFVAQGGFFFFFALDTPGCVFTIQVVVKTQPVRLDVSRQDFFVGD